jgi:hypothetical protein
MTQLLFFVLLPASLALSMNHLVIRWNSLLGTVRCYVAHMPQNSSIRNSPHTYRDLETEDDITATCAEGQAIYAFSPQLLECISFRKRRQQVLPTITGKNFPLLLVMLHAQIVDAGSLSLSLFAR